MYVPFASAKLDSAKFHEFMRRNSSADLTSSSRGGLIASLLPLLFVPDAGSQGQLIGHMARANPQWRRAEDDVTAVFSGPHAYISPSWYEEGGTVPAWNYVDVHAYGRFQIIENQEELLDIPRRSVTE
jgi:transcriptional regulator